MRSDTAFFSAADISRRFLAGLASDLLSDAAAAFVGRKSAATWSAPLALTHRGSARRRSTP